MTVNEFIDEWQSDATTVLVHTSGSTGRPKPLWVEKRRMEASARLTCAFLHLQPGDTALLCMPLDYIAGKMMVVRALTCGLTLLTVPPTSHPLAPQTSHFSPLTSHFSPLTSHFSPLTSHLSLLTSHFTPLTSHIDFAAMTPMQVYCSLQVPEERERLQAIRQLIIGGGAIDDRLAAELKTFPNAVWSTYGMTETLSHIAMRRLSGPDADLWYTPMDGVAVSITDDGCLVVDAPQVCAQTLTTNDIAELRDGRFRILGRKDNVVCSGGIKIQIEEVERLLRQHTDRAFVITKRKDEQFGEAVVLLTESTDLNFWQTLCRRHLPRYWQPRHYYHVDALPLTETGKPARRMAEQMAAEQ